jgi:hypothetical protein
MKPNHLSGKIRIVDDFKGIPIRELEELAETWLGQNYYYNWYEWAYKNIPPRIIFEELLENDGKSPDDWKFSCFNGEPRFLVIHRNRFIEHTCNVYDLNLSLLPVSILNIRKGNSREKIDPPQNFDKMLEITRKLSAGIDFVRVDLYNINGRIIFGELTNYPGAGLDKFEPSLWDTKFGSYWK